MANKKITAYPAATNTPVQTGSLIDVSELVGATYTTVKVPVDDIELDFPSWHIIGTGGEPVFGTDISNVGGAGDPSLSYYKDQCGRVHIRGLIVNAAGAATNKVLFQLPVGYRPNVTVRIPVYFVIPSGTVSDKIDNGYMTIVIETGGNVLIKEVLVAGTIYDLSPVNFRTS